METVSFPAIFARIKALLEPYATKMTVQADTDNNFHLAIINDIELAGRKFKECYFSGVTIHKTIVSFYFFPVYTHPAAITVPPELKRSLKGKNCFNFTKFNDQHEQAIAALLKDGAALYAREKIIP